ncbi:MAG: hypothetical protein KGI73_03750 [Patescibacteria group bacterium]|nr:hypothetical protein [Patescibacteria group bacterium]
MDEHIRRIRLVIAAVIIVLVAALAIYDLWYTQTLTASQTTISTTTSVGLTYTNASENDIFLTVPRSGVVITNSIIVQGYARGGWFFEGSFPVTITGTNGVIVGSGQATAGSAWTTTNFVPFTATIDVKNLYYNGTATVTLKNDNPSGDPTKDKFVSFPAMIH